jgi:NAD(P)-dependent dehydrogenase (short-subunit alcohol dehydrogenase family)
MDGLGLESARSKEYVEIPEEEFVGSVTDKVAVVTGAGRGIGAAIAKRLAVMGAISVLCGRTQAALESLATEIRDGGGKAEVARCDVSDLASVESLAETVGAKFKRVDILVNNAGVGGFSGPLHQLPPADWDRILDINLRGVYYCIRAFAPLMIRNKSGHIINISSIAGKNPLPNGAAYAASKWGLNGLTYSVADELRAHNIRVAVVCPGSTNTDLSPHEGKDLSKMLQPDDIADIVEGLVTQAPRAFTSEVVVRPTAKP